jgi:O-antigen ligase
MFSKEQLLSNLYSFNLLSALILVTLLPFSFSVAEYIALTFYFSTYTLELLFTKNRCKITIQKKQVLYLIFIVFFALILLYYFKETNLNYFQKLFEKRLPILAFGIIGLFGFNPKYKLEYFAHAIILTSIVLIIYLVCIQIGLIDFLKSNIKSEIFRFARIEKVNAHMMFNFYLNTSINFLVYLILKVKSNKIIKTIYIGFGIIIYSILFISEGRTGFIASNILLVIILFYLTFRWKKAIGFIFLAIAPIILFAIIIHHPRVSKKEFTTENRLFLWGIAEEIVVQHPIVGYGASTAEYLYTNQLKKSNNQYFNQAMKDGYMVDSHNQFIQVEMEFGVLGLLLIFSLYLYPLFVVENENRLFVYMFVIISLFQSCFDMFITGQFSVMFFLVLVLFLNVSSDQSNDLKVLDKS